MSVHIMKLNSFLKPLILSTTNQELPFALSLSTEFNFESLNEWGTHQKNTWINSNFGTLDAAQSFLPIKETMEFSSLEQSLTLVSNKEVSSSL